MKFGEVFLEVSVMVKSFDALVFKFLADSQQSPYLLVNGWIFNYFAMYGATMNTVNQKIAHRMSIYTRHVYKANKSHTNART